MDVQTVALAALLHDIGKVYQRYRVRNPTQFKPHGEEGALFIRKYTNLKEILDNDGNLIEYAVEKHMKKWGSLNKEKLEDQLIHFVKLGDNLSASQRENKTSNNEIQEDKLTDHEKEEEEEAELNESIKGKMIKSIINNKLEKLFIDEGIEPLTYSRSFIEEKVDEKEYEWFEKYLNSLTFGDKKRTTEWERYLLIVSMTDLMREIAFNVPSTIMYSTKLSLYTHSLTASAIASSAYVYGEGKLISRMSSDNAFLLTRIELGGIQDFITLKNFKNSNFKKSMKIMRGRSTLVNMIMFWLSHKIAYNLTKTPTSILYSNGGSTLLLLPNTEKAKKYLEELIGKLNEEFMEEGISLRLSFGTSEFSPKTFKESFQTIYSRLMKNLHENKNKQFIHKYIFETGKERRHECRLCKKSEEDELQDDLCKICHLCEKFGQINKEKLKEFPKFVLSESDLEETNNLFNIMKKIVDETNGDEKNEDEKLCLVYIDIKQLNELLKGNKKLLFDRFKEYYTKGTKGIWRMLRFVIHTAETHNNDHDQDDSLLRDKEYGLNLVGDVDNLGMLFRKIDKLDHYVYVSDIIERAISRGIVRGLEEAKEEGFKEKYYIGYVGGDDVNLLVEWPTAFYIYENICDSIESELDAGFSAGGVITKPKEPLYLTRMLAQTNESKSKNYKQDGSHMTIFGMSVKREELGKCFKEAKKDVERFGEVEALSFLYGINKLIKQLFGTSIEQDRVKKYRNKFIIYSKYKYARWKNKTKENLYYLEEKIESFAKENYLEKSSREIRHILLYVSLISLLKRRLEVNKR